jgi:transmembrane sensor
MKGSLFFNEFFIMPENRLPYLFDRYMNGTSTEREDIELCTYILASEHAAAFEQLEKQYWEKANLNTAVIKDGEAEKFLIKIFNHTPRKAKLFSLGRVAVAASLLIAVATGGYFLFFDKPSKPDEIVKTKEPAKDVEAPKASKAIITLADGSQIFIDSLNTFMQGNVQVSKTADGKIVYNGSAKEVIYNTLINPRGSKVINMRLADGTHLWLNAGSSVTYPVTFVGNERKVSITGEAYFEVVASANPSEGGGALRSFIVQNGDMQVRVLGTHFNVNAYDDEDEIKVTLLEGSVEVENKNSKLRIKPGQQAQVSSMIKVASDVDVEQVMAWKNGLFDFNKTEIGEIMRQLERWYDMQVEYPQGKPGITLTGNISRNINASKVLQMLEMSGVHFRIEGKKIIVLSVSP